MCQNYIMTDDTEAWMDEAVFYLFYFHSWPIQFSAIYSRDRELMPSKCSAL